MLMATVLDREHTIQHALHSRRAIQQLVSLTTLACLAWRTTIKLHPPTQFVS